MSLSIRNTGDLTKASFFNDIRDLLLGNMTDQQLTPKGSLILQAINAPPAAPTLALASGSSLSVGAYRYAIGYSGVNGVTVPGTIATITTTSGNQVVNLSAIPTSTLGVGSRIVYRSKVGGTQLYQVAVINNTSSTTYTDTTPDSGLTVQAPIAPTLGGNLQLKDSTGALNLTIGSDGDLYSTGTLGVSATYVNFNNTSNATKAQVNCSDGSGYLAANNISWTSNGNLSIGQLTCNSVVSSGSGSFTTLSASGATTVNSLVVTNGATMQGGAAILFTTGGTGKVYIQSSTPASPSNGDIWIDTSVNLG